MRRPRAPTVYLLPGLQQSCPGVGGGSQATAETGVHPQDCGLCDGNGFIPVADMGVLLSEMCRWKTNIEFLFDTRRVWFIIPGEAGGIFGVDRPDDLTTGIFRAAAKTVMEMGIRRLL